MQPLILAEQTPQVVADFLEATFPATTLGFEDIMARFLAEPGSGQGAYVTVGLSFRKQTGEENERTVSPQLLTHYSDNWYGFISSFYPHPSLPPCKAEGEKRRHPSS